MYIGCPAFSVSLHSLGLIYVILLAIAFGVSAHRTEFHIQSLQIVAKLIHLLFVEDYSKNHILLSPYKIDYKITYW
jgi:hypothetical protein